MDIIQMILPVAVGELIGYCTNYIAIKMLFRPKNEIRIGGWKLPFTPGVIPKNKGRLARAAGNAVGNNLVTGDDIKNILCGEELKAHIAEAFADAVFSDDVKISAFAEELSGMDYEPLTIRVSAAVSEKIKDEASSVDFASIIKEVASKTISEKLSGSMLSMFINESTVSMITEPIGEVLTSYIEENGAEAIYPVVKSKLDEMGDKSTSEILNEFNADRSAIEDIIGRLYLMIMEKHASDITSFIDVKQIVENKINAMSTDDLEELVMSVMKNELQTIINLGALIGAVIGILNIFIM